ncbi:30S ribosomal protein S4 [bacterium]|jgi:small subunit ribosomal protein S4|nr:30S ribosomal protein S4 [bacterium]
MASCVGSTCTRCRQAGKKLFLKGSRCRTTKCAIEKKLPAPGQHGKRSAMRRVSEYGKQLAEKQHLKWMYGMREGAFKRFFRTSSHCKGATGDNLLSFLERRLDNVVYRLKMATSRSQARQMVVHGHVTVNSNRVNSPSFFVSENDVIGFTQSTLDMKDFVKNVIDKRMNIGVRVPEWLELKKKDHEGVILRLPGRQDMTDEVEDHLIVELYSK